MNSTSPAESRPPGPIPADDPRRDLTHVSPDTDASLPHLGVVGDTYTILVSGQDTAGRYTLIDMHVPPGGGPPPHRHDFEEMFTILDGEIELTFRGAVGVLLDSRTEPPPALDDAARSGFMAKAVALAPQYRTELLIGEPRS
jgi:mannose-6-phosphate isomerase-like protein (cupin superfamily)